MKKPSFFQCAHCGNTIDLIIDAGVSMYCCGEAMKTLRANGEDAAREIHVPELTLNGSAVRVIVGSCEHPMTPDHRIDWVYLLTDKGGQRKEPGLDNRPEVSFALTEDDAPIAAYAYCNQHGLWFASCPRKRAASL